MLVIAEYKNLIGEVFGLLTVLSETKDKNGKKAWLCRCSCEKQTEIIIDTTRLTSGVKRHCGCQRAYRKNPILPDEYIHMKKICSTCGEEKYYNKFYFTEKIINNITKYHFNSECITCEKLRSLNNYHNNFERCSKRNKKFHDNINNKNKRKLKCKKWREDNAEWKAEYQKEYWAKIPPEKLKEYYDDRFHKNHELTTKEWKACKEYFNNCCAYCGMPIEIHYELFETDLHREHKDSKGNTLINNCVPSCQSCNYRKWVHKFDDWYNKTNLNFTQERLDKINKWCEEDYKAYYEPKMVYRIVRKKNEGKTTYYFELWKLDDNRNLIECLSTRNKKRDLNNDIIKYYGQMEVFYFPC